MELEELIELPQLLQDLHPSMEPDMQYPDDIRNYEDHLLLMICRAQQEEEDDQQLMQAHIAGFLSSRCNLDQSFPDHLQQFDHSDQELAGTAEMGCKWLIRSSFDHSNFLNDQLNYTARGGLKEPDDDQKDGAGIRLHHTAGGRRSRLLDDQKFAGTRSKCLKRSNQYNFLNDENDQSTSLTQNDLINDQSDESAAAASSEEEGGMSCSSNGDKKKKKKKEKEKNLQRSSSSSASATFSKNNLDSIRHGDARQSPIVPRALTSAPRAPTSGIAPALQYRRPIIIHTYPPKIIHTHPSKFMWLVQSLTGSSETRSRCLKSQPSDHDPLHDQHPPAGSPASSAGSIEAQLQIASAKTADQHCLSFHQLAGVSAASTQPPLQNSHVITPKPVRYHQANNIVINPFKNHINQYLMNVSTNNNPSLISPKTPTNYLPNLINYKDECSRILSEGAERGCTSATNASCCTSTTIEGNFSATEVSPRGPLISATQFKGAATKEVPFILSTEACNNIVLPPPPSNFENWSLGLHHRSISNPNPHHLSNLNLNQNANYISNLNPKLNHLSNLNPNINVVPRSQGLINFNSLSSDYINHGPSSSQELDAGWPYNHHEMSGTSLAMWGIGQHPPISLSISGK